jgi:hypothetical protein
VRINPQQCPLSGNRTFIRGDEIRALRELRRQFADSGYVFATERGGPFTTDAVNRLIKRIGARAGFTLPVHAHILPTAAATRLPTKATTHAPSRSGSVTAASNRGALCRAGVEPLQESLARLKPPRQSPQPVKPRTTDRSPPATGLPRFVKSLHGRTVRRAVLSRSDVELASLCSRETVKDRRALARTATGGAAWGSFWLDPPAPVPGQHDGQATPVCWWCWHLAHLNVRLS